MKFTNGTRSAVLILALVAVTIAVVALLTVKVAPAKIKPFVGQCNRGHPCTPAPSPTLAPTLTLVPTPSATPVSYAFHDEFDGITLGPVWGRAWQYGAATFNRSQTRVADGMLQITMARNGTGWLSDQVDTYGSYTQRYGYFEARMKIPKGRGVWPAFWMAELASVPTPAELDVQEICANPLGENGGNDASVLHATVHFPEGGLLGTDYHTVDLSLDWHVYGMRWRVDRVIFFLDGQEYWRYTDAAKIPAVSMPIILSLAGGRSWCSAPDSTTPASNTMYVDWVRTLP